MSIRVNYRTVGKEFYMAEFAEQSAPAYSHTLGALYRRAEIAGEGTIFFNYGNNEPAPFILLATESLKNKIIREWENPENETSAMKLKTIEYATPIFALGSKDMKTLHAFYYALQAEMDFFQKRGIVRNPFISRSGRKTQKFLRGVYNYELETGYVARGTELLLTESPQGIRYSNKEEMRILKKAIKTSRGFRSLRLTEQQMAPLDRFIDTSDYRKLIRRNSQNDKNEL